MLILYENKINSSFEEVDKCVRNITESMGKYDYLSDEFILFKVGFVLRELMNNSVEHGNKFDFAKFILCKVFYDANKLFIEVADEGDGINRTDKYFREIDIDKRERQRGLKLIQELDFDIAIDRNTIKLKLDIL